MTPLPKILRVLGLAAAAIIVVIGLRAIGVSSLPGTSLLGASTLALEPCRLRHPAGLGSLAARCGHLTVPVDPTGRKTKATLELSVAVVPAFDTPTTKEPLFILAGGPGQGAQEFYAAFAAVFGPIERSRDIVLIDQRGTGNSNRLDCPSGDLAEDGLNEADLQKLSRQCYESLGPDVAFYTTSAAVADLEAVRLVLHYARIDLYGISYGTRVAQQYVRKFPQYTSAIVLDGVVPPTLAIGPDSSKDAQASLDQIFEHCQAMADCDRTFPDLKARFLKTMQALDKKAASVEYIESLSGKHEQIQMDASQVSSAIRLLNYRTANIALLPWLIDEVTRGNYEPLYRQMHLSESALGDELALGMNLNVSCTEDVPAYVGIPLQAPGYLGSAQETQLRAICKQWPAGFIDADLHAPLESRVPALLLSGSLDPVTPASYSHLAAKGFSQVREILIKGQGHGQITVPCAGKVIASFLDTLKPASLDAKCLERSQVAPFFLTSFGPGA